MQKRKELTSSERGWLEHLRRAHEQGVTLVRYARSAWVKVGSLYEARRNLTRKGVRLPEAAADVTAEKAGEFIAVHVAAPARSPAEVVCRLRHPGGREIECTSWPEASWVAQIFGGGAHDTP